MSSLIEQAAARLAQLRTAGAEVPPSRAATESAQAQQVPPDAAPAFSLDVPPEFGLELPAEFASAPEPVLSYDDTPSERQSPLEPREPSDFDFSAQPGMAPQFEPAPFAADPEAAPAVSAPRPVVTTSRRVDLDLPRLAALNFVTPGSPRSRIADQYRVIKRPLIANALGKGAAPVAHGNRIMITSSLPGEGKTFTAVNLALSIAAELDTTVMLVDADVGRPSVLKTLGLAPGPGLLDVLEGRATMPEVLLRTNVDKLTLLSAGTLHDRATEVLASDGMHTLLQEVAQRYDDRIIIFDSPPLLLTTEARALAAHMGQIIVVVQAGHTSQSDVQTALATIEFCPVKLLLLNQARGSKLDAYATGYKYGYGYRYGQEHGDQPS
jgi:exopolysaccharide/PEP-CTERM locus tyrosine autokinase